MYTVHNTYSVQNPLGWIEQKSAEERWRRRLNENENKKNFQDKIAKKKRNI